eukprot:752568-Hanusia_phi.AAC.4
MENFRRERGFARDSTSSFELQQMPRRIAQIRGSDHISTPLFPVPHSSMSSDLNRTLGLATASQHSPPPPPRLLLSLPVAFKPSIHVLHLSYGLHGGDTRALRRNQQGCQEC